MTTQSRDVYSDYTIFTADQGGSGQRMAAWQRIGKNVAGAETAEEAIKAASLDFKVKTEPLFRQVDVDGELVYRPDPEAVITVREDNARRLGLVTPRYEPIQNDEAFGFFDQVVAQNKAKFVSAGSLFGGRVVWLQAELPNPIEVIPGDPIQKYAFFSNGHDGGLAARMALIPQRVWCQNQILSIIAGIRDTFRIVHRGDIRTKIEQAKEALGLIDTYHQAAAEQWKILAGTSYSNVELNRYLAALFPIPAQPGDMQRQAIWERDRETIVRQRQDVARLAEEGAGYDQVGGVKGSVYGLWQAALEWADHEYRGTDERRLFSGIFGDRADTKKRAYELALELAKN